MKNMDFLNACYKYLNRLIPAADLVKLLEKIDGKEVKAVKEEIEELIYNIPQLGIEERDSYELWIAIADCITNNDYFNKNFDKLTDYEMLEYITQEITSFVTPQMEQKDFEDLVKAGIENDARESLWRLAFIYESSELSYDSIVDYFIKVKDADYLGELISTVSGKLDIDKIIDKIKDKELIEGLIERKSYLENKMTKEQFKKLENKLGK